MVGGIPHEREVGDTLGSRVTPLRFDADAVVYGSANALLATEIALSRLYGDVSEQELNLLQLSPGCVAEPRTRATEVMGCQLFDPGSFRAILDDMPHDPLRDPVSPCLAGTANASEQAAGSYVCRSHP
jgi:hypothetical protein